MKFNYPVEVVKHTKWPFNPEFDRSEILQCMNAFFGHNQLEDCCFDFYEVNRPGYGIDRAVTVISYPNKESYAIRIFIKPDPLLQDMSFDKAAYFRERVQKLYSALREHYPATYFLNTKYLLIILQRFIDRPVCSFKSSSELYQLLEVIHFASDARILLDYNHNHWLMAANGVLKYVDTDYMGHILPDRPIALSENFNQAMVFINENNCKFLKEALINYLNKGNDTKEFVSKYISVLKTFINQWDTIEQISEPIRRKLVCLKETVKFYGK